MVYTLIRAFCGDVAVATGLSGAAAPRTTPGKKVGFQCLDDSGGHLVADLGLGRHRRVLQSLYIQLSRNPSFSGRDGICRAVACLECRNAFFIKRADGMWNADKVLFDTDANLKSHRDFCAPGETWTIRRPSTRSDETGEKPPMSRPAAAGASSASQGHRRHRLRTCPGYILPSNHRRRCSRRYDTPAGDGTRGRPWLHSSAR